MRSLIACTVLLFGTMLIHPGVGSAQKPASSKASPFGAHPFDLALTYSPEHAQVVNQGRTGFWLEGLGGDASLGLYRGLGVSAKFDYAAANNILQTSVNLSRITFDAGPRYTFDLDRLFPAKPGAGSNRAYVQALFGGVYGFNSVFPAAGGTTASASSYAIETGGGIDWALGSHFGLRTPDVEWVHSALPNTAANAQNNLRLGFGVSYRLTPAAKR